MDKKEFDQIISKHKVVLADMFATWCGPCQMMKPIIEEIEEDYEKNEDVKVIAIDIDENPDITSEYSVMSVPTFLVFKEGKAADTIVGAVPKDTLLSKIEDNLK